MATLYKCVSNRAEDLTGGRTLAPGEYAEVDDEDTHNKTIIDEGRLIPVPKEVTLPPVPEEQGPTEAETTPNQVGDPEDPESIRIEQPTEDVLADPAPPEPKAAASGKGKATDGGTE